MTAIPGYLTARNMTLFAVNPAQTNAAGIITLGATLDFKTLGIFDSMDYQAQNVDEDIHSGDALVANYQPLYDDWTITINELSSGNGNSALMDIYHSYMYLRVAAQNAQPGYNIGAPSYGNLLVGIGKRGTIGRGIVEGKNVVQMTLKPCGILPYWGPGPSPI